MCKLGVVVLHFISFDLNAAIDALPSKIALHCLHLLCHKIQH